MHIFNVHMYVYRYVVHTIILTKLKPYAFSANFKIRLNAMHRWDFLHFLLFPKIFARDNSNLVGEGLAGRDSILASLNFVSD